MPVVWQSAMLVRNPGTIWFVVTAFMRLSLVRRDRIHAVDRVPAPDKSGYYEQERSVMLVRSDRIHAVDRVPAPEKSGDYKQEDIFRRCACISDLAPLE